MISTRPFSAFAPPSFFAQAKGLVSAARTLIALRRLRQQMVRGAPLVGHPALASLARALGVHAAVAHDVYMGRLSPSSAAEDIVGARAALSQAAKMAPWLAPWSRVTSMQARVMGHEVSRVRARARQETAGLAAASSARIDGHRRQLRAAKKSGRPHQAKMYRELRADETQRLEELNAEMQLLLKS